MTAPSSASTNRQATIPPTGAGDVGPRFARRSGRLIGALFLAGFVTYGTGSALVNSVVDTSNILDGVSAQQTTLVLGAFLMLLNTPVDIGKAVLFFPLVERHGKRTALTYLAAMVFQVSMMAVGALCLLSLVPLAEQLDTGRIGAAAAQSLGSLAIDANTMAYQIGQAGLAFGAFFLCVLLYRARMVPRALAMWGAIGYVLHFAGAVAEIFGAPISLILLVPGGLFELTLGVWLLVRGLEVGATTTAGS